MSNDSIARVRYFNQQFLRAKDFDDEQSYHLKMRRRHNIAHHIWGIVNGLQITKEPDGIFVQPGIAIDGYGREIVLKNRVQISETEFSRVNSDAIDVWITYSRKGFDSGREKARICNSSSDQEYNRWNESPKIRIDKYQIGKNTRKPDSVDINDLSFQAHSSPPDDPVRDWPVYLGAVHIVPDTDPYEYTIDFRGRPNAGLVSENVISPSDRAKLTLDQSGSLKVSLKNNLNNWHDHIKVENTGEIDLNGRTSISGDLTMIEGAIKFRSINSIPVDSPECNSEENSVQDLPRPWRIYKHVCHTLTGDTDPVPEEYSQLRIEMGTIGKDKRNQVVVGAWNPDSKKFEPILSVGNNSSRDESYSVTVHGDLLVRGSVSQEEASPGKKLTKQAKEYLTGAYSSGISGANAQLPKFYENPSKLGGCDFTSKDVRDNIIAQLLLNENNIRETFIDELLNKPDLVDTIENRLILNEDLVSEVVNKAQVQGTLQSALTAGKISADVISVFEDHIVDDHAEQLVESLIADDAELVAGELLDYKNDVDEFEGRVALGNKFITFPAKMRDILDDIVSDRSVLEELIEVVSNSDIGDASTDKITQLINTLFPETTDTSDPQPVLDISLARERVVVQSISHDVTRRRIEELLPIDENNIDDIMDKVFADADTTPLPEVVDNVIAKIMEQELVLEEITNSVMDPIDGNVNIQNIIMDSIVNDQTEEGQLQRTIDRMLAFEGADETQRPAIQLMSNLMFDFDDDQTQNHAFQQLVTDLLEYDSAPNGNTALEAVIQRQVDDGVALLNIVDAVLLKKSTNEATSTKHYDGVNCILTELEKFRQSDVSDESEVFDNFVTEVNDNFGEIKNAICP